MNDNISADDVSNWVWKGHANANVFICGHSHRYAMLSAVQEGLVDSHISGAVLTQSIPRHVEVDDAYWEMAMTTSQNRPLGIVWGGNAHNTLFLLNPNEFQLAYEEGHSQYYENVPYVPVEMIRASLLPSIAGIDLVLSRFESVRQVMVIGTPPPKREHLIRRGLLREPVFIKFAEQQGVSLEAVAIASLNLRIKIWSIMQDMLSESATRFGAIFIPVPERTRDGDGALCEDLSTLDATHANSGYGAIMWGEIYTRIGFEGGIR